MTDHSPPMRDLRAHQPVIKPKKDRCASVDMHASTLPSPVSSAAPGANADVSFPTASVLNAGSGRRPSIGSALVDSTDSDLVPGGTASTQSHLSSLDAGPYSTESMLSKQSLSSLSLRSSDSAGTPAATPPTIAETSPQTSASSLFPPPSAATTTDGASPPKGLAHHPHAASRSGSLVPPRAALQLQLPTGRSRSQSSAELSPVFSRISMNRGITSEVEGNSRSAAMRGRHQCDEDDDDDDGAYATIASPEGVLGRQQAASQFFASLNEAPKFSFHRALGEKPLKKYPLSPTARGGHSGSGSGSGSGKKKASPPLNLGTKSMPASQMRQMIPVHNERRNLVSMTGTSSRTTALYSSNSARPTTPTGSISLKSPSAGNSSISSTSAVGGAKKPKTIGSYLLSNVVLGSGQYGEVREGLVIASALRVAIKIVKLQALRKIDRKALQNIQREIKVLRKIKMHDRCVQLLDVIDRPEKEKKYLVFEYAPHGSLADTLKNAPANRISLDYAHYYFKQLMEGLDYLHSLGIVHRDIKPANLLFGQQGLMIADFGSAELLDAFNRSDACETSSGTPAYHPPEVLSGKSSFSGYKVDVWAAGITLYQMVTGVLPFQGKGYEALIRSVTTDELQLPDLIPASLCDLLQGMLHKDETKRLSIEQIRKHPWTMQNDTQWSNQGLLHRRHSQRALRIKPPASPTNLATSSRAALVSPKFLVQRRQSTQQFLSDAATYLDDSEQGSTLPSEGSAGSLAEGLAASGDALRRPRSHSQVYECEEDTRDPHEASLHTIGAIGHTTTTTNNNTTTTEGSRPMTPSSRRGRSPSPATVTSQGAQSNRSDTKAPLQRKLSRRQRQMEDLGYEMQLDDDVVDEPYRDVIDHALEDDFDERHVVVDDDDDSVEVGASGRGDGSSTGSRAHRHHKRRSSVGDTSLQRGRRSPSAQSLPGGRGGHGRRRGKGGGEKEKCSIQ
eukprot:TRINITY_DN884_c0_g2_i2.p1 TRINITY_DN884_c0_g2~~TRINITY_DN884_c0_g2_i2.p1  ORF type:complete len:959 (+),score=198.07 TRINITY_DN884_c0_g2_i2:632-3508(+)